MNGFAALDIHPHRRYVVDIGGRRSSRCRLHINFALFLHSLDFTQNLGRTPVLALFVWFCTWLVCVSGAVLGLVSLLLCVCSVILFLSSSVTGGIIYLVLAFLASPFGLPTAALWLLDKIQGLRYWIQDTVFE